MVGSYDFGVLAALHIKAELCIKSDGHFLDMIGNYFEGHVVCRWSNIAYYLIFRCLATRIWGWINWVWTFRLWSTSSLLLLIDLLNCHCKIRGGSLIWKFRSLWRFVIVYIQRRHNERLIWQIACRSALLQHGVLTLELTRFPADLGRSLSFYVFYFVQFVAKNEAFNDRYFAAFKGLVELLLQFVLLYDAF